MTEWPSKRGPITKIMPSDGCIGDTVPWRWESGTISTNLDGIWGMSGEGVSGVDGAGDPAGDDRGSGGLRWRIRRASNDLRSAAEPTAPTAAEPTAATAAEPAAATAAEPAAATAQSQQLGALTTTAAKLQDVLDDRNAIWDAAHTRNCRPGQTDGCDLDPGKPPAGVDATRVYNPNGNNSSANNSPLCIEGNRCIFWFCCDQLGRSLFRRPRFFRQLRAGRKHPGKCSGFPEQCPRPLFQGRGSAAAGLGRARGLEHLGGLGRRQQRRA